MLGKCPSTQDFAVLSGSLGLSKSANRNESIPGTLYRKERVMERYYNTARRSFMMPELASLTQRHVPPAFVAV
jgi:hypothetical protein